MKKISFLLISCALAASSLNAWGTEVSGYDGQAQLEAARADIANWMKYLPDNVFAAHVSIPGSHDSATGHEVSLASSSQAQHATIDEQLAAGIRAFDFRPQLSGSADDRYLNCNHGMAATKLRMSEAFAKLTAYLDEHPSEFMVIHLFRANLKNDGDEAQKAEHNYLTNLLFNEGEFADYFIDFDPWLKVSDMRGKIVVFRRDALAYDYIKKAGNLAGWPGDKDLWVGGTAAIAQNAANPGVYGRVRVTDVSSPKNEDELNTELQSITNLFTYNCTEKRPNEAAAEGAYNPEWSMIFTSGEYTSGQKGYLANATHTNPHLVKLINEAEVSGPTGVVFSDWVLRDTYTYSGTEYVTKGSEVVTAVIENNFKYIGEFIIDDDIVKPQVSTETDRFGGQEFFLRNVATGQYLSAGADWGTHAILDDNGILIQPFFIKSSGCYMLRTTFKQNWVDNYLGDNCYIDNTAFNPVKFVEAGAEGIYYIVFDSYVAENGTTRQVRFALTPEQTGNTYTDGATMLIQNVEFAEGNTLQQWQPVTREERLKELAATATPESPVSMTFAVKAHKFHANDGENLAAWNFTCEDGSTRAKLEIPAATNEWYDKDQLLRAYVGYHSKSNVSKMYWTLSQVVEGLPDGVYGISMQALADNLPLDNEEIFSFTVNGVDMREGMATNSTGKLTGAQALAKFRDAALNNCIIERDGIVVNGGRLEILIKKGIVETNDYNAFFMDNINLTYYGPQGMEAVEYTLSDDYDTLILPFGAEIPAGLELFSVAGYSQRQETYHVLDLKAENKIEANVPYLVRRAAESRSVTGPIKFWGVKADDTQDSYTNGLLTGVHVESAVPAGAFTLSRINDNAMAFTRVADGNQTVAAGRAYIHDTADEAINAENSKVNMLHVAATTGVDSVVADSEGFAPTTPVDVYTLAGVMIRGAVAFSDALDGLEKGVYILRSGSVAVKIAL